MVTDRRSVMPKVGVGVWPQQAQDGDQDTRSGAHRRWPCHRGRPCRVDVGVNGPSRHQAEAWTRVRDQIACTDVVQPHM